MINPRNCLLRVICLVILAASVTHAAGEGPGNAVYRRAPYVSFPMLTDPTTFAISVKMEQDIVRVGDNLVKGLDRFKRFDIDVNVNGLYPMRYHPEGIIEADLGLNLNWIAWVGGVSSEDAGGFEGTDEKVVLGKPYLGGLSVEFSGEASQDFGTETWRLHNYNLAASAHAQIPGTSLDLFGWLLVRPDTQVFGTSPLELGFSLRVVEEDSSADTSYVRFDLTANWGLYMSRGVYFYPRFVVSQVEGSRAETYFRAELVRYMSGTDVTSASGGNMKPYVLVRYVDGRQPPDYVPVSEWYFGIGAELPF